jgi:hypothetical protein
VNALPKSGDERQHDDRPRRERGLHVEQRGAVRRDRPHHYLTALCGFKQRLLRMHDALGLAGGARREHDRGDVGGFWPMRREPFAARDDAAVIGVRAAARAEADAADPVPGGGDRSYGLTLEILVMNQDSCVEPVKRLPEPLGCFADMQAAGDPSAQGSREPRHRVPRGAAAQIGDHLNLIERLRAKP